MKIAKVAINLPIYKYFSYEIPKKFYEKLQIGDSVLVPFGNFKKVGIVVDIANVENVDFEIKTIIAILKDSPLTPLQVEIGKILTEHFLNSPGPSFFLLKGAKKVDVKRYYKITEKGLKSLSFNNLSPVKKQILELLKEKIYTKRGIQRFIKNDKIGYILSNLTREGLLEIQEEITENKRSKLLYIRVKNSNLNKLTPLEQQIIQFLERYTDWCPFSYIRKKFKITKKKLELLEKAGFVEFKYFENIMDSFLEPTLREKNVEQLTKEQQIAYDTVKRYINSHKEFLFAGVTGSGKTEVYFRLAIDVVKKGKKVLILVPEISLTPQIAALFKSHFNNRVLIYHSKLTKLERKNIYNTVKEGNFDVLIGPRSILFLPYDNLGMIVIDEFQDESYNQRDMEPYYNGNYIAKYIAKHFDIPIIYVSATPLIDYYYYAKNDKITLFNFTQRAVKGATLPKIELVNMSEEKDSMISSALYERIKSVVEAHKQVMLFYNRRGFFRNVRCPKCGYIFKCEYCDIPLIYHKDINSLVCHYCGRIYNIPAKCPQCGNYHLSFKGIGIEQVEEKLKLLFPKYRIARLDQDIAKDILKIQNLFSQFKAGDIDILLGTQIITKGLDFPNVTLVGVISTEILFSLPDFRTTERAYSLLRQVSGRAGRGKEAGTVIIQTYNPGNNVLKYALSDNYDEFYRYEISMREKLKYPPFINIGKILLNGKNEDKVQKEGKTIKEFLDNNSIIAYGPMPAILKKLNNIYYYEILFKYEDFEKIYPILTQIKEKHKIRFII